VRTSKGNSTGLSSWATGKKTVTKEDLPYIISGVLVGNLYEEKSRVEAYTLTPSS